jgi:hypothetical protein
MNGRTSRNLEYKFLGLTRYHPASIKVLKGELCFCTNFLLFVLVVFLISYTVALSLASSFFLEELKVL